MNDTYNASASYYKAPAKKISPNTTPIASKHSSSGESSDSSSANSMTDKSINDIYAQLVKLTSLIATNQGETNEKMNEFNLKLSYINESFELVKHNLNDLSQQIILLLQNSGMLNQPYFNQSKLLETIQKNIHKMGKDLEELSLVAPVPSHLSHPSQSFLPLQSQRHFDDEVDYSKSNPTSPFISNRFNFDINTLNKGFPEMVGEKKKRSRGSDVEQVQQPQLQGQIQQGQSQHRTQAHVPQNISSYTLPIPNILPEEFPKSQMKYMGGNAAAAAAFMSALPSNQTQNLQGQNLQGQNLQGQNLQGQSLQGQNLQSQNLQSQNLQSQNLLANLQSQSSQSQSMTQSQSLSSQNLSSSLTSQSQPRFYQDDIEDKQKKKRKRRPSVVTPISTAASVASPTSTSAADEEMPIYKLERSLKSISEIWKEYEYGLNDKPPLRLLEAKYGTKWRNETESRTFLRRKKIYEAIECGKSKGLREDQVIADLESYRSFEHNGVLKRRPLLWLCQNVPDKYTR